MMMANRRGDDGSAGLKTTRNRRDASAKTGDGDDAAAAAKSASSAAAAKSASLPRWMRLYLYAMHGVTLDVVLSSLGGLLRDGDPKLVGFSSPYLCVAHALTHLALEQLHAQRARAPGGAAVFTLLLYPCAYVGLQLLVGTVVDARTAQAHYVLALYFAQVFHGAVARLRYHRDPDQHQDPQNGTHPQNGVQAKDAESRPTAGPVAAARERGREREEPPPAAMVPASSPSPQQQLGLPDVARFVFYGMQGFVDEVIFTAAFNVTEGRAPRGHTSLWSFLMYGSCSFAVEKLYVRLRRRAPRWGAWRRLPLYVACIYAWEFTWGLALRQFGACSWDYSHYRYNVMGLVTLVYLPGWVGLSLYQDVLADVLFRVRLVGEDEGRP
ncbi:unnamed protein product [Merluccius merluccius]